MSLIDRVQAEMASDTEDPDEQSELLKQVYEAADEAGKSALDSAFIALCGYSLSTLIKEE